MNRLLLATLAATAVIAVQESARAQDSGSVGAIIFVDPLAANLAISPSSLPVKHQATARSTITNQGPASLSTTTATLLIDAQAVTVTGGTTRTLSAIAPHSSVQASWRLCAARAGSYLAMVRVTSTDTAGHQFETETQAVLLQISGKRSGNSSGAC